MLDYNKWLLQWIFITILSLIIVVFTISFVYSINNLWWDNWIITKNNP